MNTESLRIADQLRRAFTGDPWHGSPLRELLAGVTAQQARSRPLASAHSIWELVLHIHLYVDVAFQATQGVPMPKLFGTERDWPAVPAPKGSWTIATDNLFQRSEELAGTIAGFTDARLQDAAPGRDYDFYYLFHGVVQHSLYHGGQIAMLKRALPAI
jgi:hypothetical protein